MLEIIIRPTVGDSPGPGKVQHAAPDSCVIHTEQVFLMEGKGHAIFTSKEDYEQFCKSIGKQVVAAAAPKPAKWPAKDDAEPKKPADDPKEP